MIPKLKPRPLNSARSTTGEAARRSVRMKSSRQTRPAANMARIAFEVQPRPSPRLIATVKNPSSPNSSTAPGMSRPLGRCSLGLSTSSRQASSAPTSPKGMRSQKMARQSISSISRPPRDGPAAAPAPTVETIRPSPVPRLEGGKAAVMIAAPLAMVID